MLDAIKFICRAASATNSLPFDPKAYDVHQAPVLYSRCGAIVFGLASPVGRSRAAAGADRRRRLQAQQRLHFCDQAGRTPPIVFIHGASANLYDPLGAFLSKLDGRADLLFVDRPGHGHSDRGSRVNDLPDGQADAIATLMTKRGIRKAIIVSHSFGGAVAASFALNHKEMVAGLLFLSPAVYPFGDDVAWYYRAAKAPVTGWLFSGLLAPTVGLASIDAATRAVFAPNPRPADYIAKAHILLATRPSDFRYNAIDIANLDGYLKKASRQYPEIRAPTIIITGDRDGIVSPHIHSDHLARDIHGSKLVQVHNLGHKPDYVVTDLAIAAIEKIAGKRQSLTRQVERAEHGLANTR